MEWNLNKNKPICPQICEGFCVEIASGGLPPESKLPSVREVAIAAGVNPNTVQKSFEELERMGLIYSVRSVGWFVTQNKQAAEETVKKLAAEKTDLFFSAMEKLGFSIAEIKTMVEEWTK